MYTCESDVDAPHAQDALDARASGRPEEQTSERLHAEASEWVARLDRPDPDGKTLAQFERWLASSVRHEAAYARLATTWHRLDGLRALRPADSAEIDPDLLRDALVAPQAR